MLQLRTITIVYKQIQIITRKELDWRHMHVFKESQTDLEVLTNFEGSMLLLLIVHIIQFLFIFALW